MPGWNGSWGHPDGERASHYRTVVFIVDSAKQSGWKYILIVYFSIVGKDLLPWQPSSISILERKAGKKGDSHSRQRCEADAIYSQIQFIIGHLDFLRMFPPSPGTHFWVDISISPHNSI